MPIQTIHPELERVLPVIKKTDDAFRGDVVEYVPKRESQSPQQYEVFRSRPSFYNVTERTLTALVGALTRKPATVAGFDLLEFRCADGSTFEELLNTLYSDLMSTGKVGIFVDIGDDGIPYCTPYNGLNIINWSHDFVVLQEHYYAPDPDDRYKMMSMIRFRELYLDQNDLFAVRIWEQVGREHWEVAQTIEPTIRGSRIDFIPFVPITPWDTTQSVYKPPLAVLANINIEHFVLQACLAHVAWVLSSPTPVITGELADDRQVIGLGGDRFIHLTQGSSASFLEFSGQGTSFLTEMVKEKENQMFSFGSRLLQHKNGVEGAETLQIRLGAESSSLVQIANAVEQGLEQILNIISLFRTPSAPEVEVHLNKDFTPIAISPAEVKSLLELYAAGTIDLGTLQRRLYEGEIITEMPDSTTSE